MSRKQQSANVEERQPQQKPEVEVKKKREKKVQPPLDPTALKPEAAEHLAKGTDAKDKLRVAAEAVELLGLEGTAKRLWKDAERAYKAAEREARKIQKAGSKGERAEKTKAKKMEKIAKLREQLEKLLAEEAEA